MNKAQKLLQPMVEAADKKFRHIIDGEGYDGGFTAGYSNGMDDAYAELATLPDAITLADVPVVEWEDTWGFRHSKYTHGEYEVKEMVNDDGPDHVVHLLHKGESLGYWSSATKAKRAVDIRIHLAALERKLLAELAGGE